MNQLIKDGLITSQVLIPEQSLAAGKLILHYVPEPELGHSDILIRPGSGKR